MKTSFVSSGRRYSYLGLLPAGDSDGLSQLRARAITLRQPPFMEERDENEKVIGMKT
jgi:hypothetical protein